MIAGAYYLGRVVDFRAGYYPVIAILIACNALFVWRYREPRLPPGAAPPFRLGAFLASFWINPRRQPDFGRAWLAWLFLWTGYALGTGGFLFLYVQNVTGFVGLFPGSTVQAAMSQIQIAQTAAGVPLMMLAALLSDRLKRRKAFIAAGGLLVIAGLIGLAVSPAWGIVLIASTAIGVGFRIFYSLGQALATEILPSAASRGQRPGRAQHRLDRAADHPPRHRRGAAERAGPRLAGGLRDPVLGRRAQHRAGDRADAAHPGRPLIGRFPPL